MKRLHFGLIGLFLSATLFCVYGQNLANFLHDNLGWIRPVEYLSGLTALGIFCYLLVGIILFVLFKRPHFSGTLGIIYLVILSPIALTASFFAMAVTAAWWG